MGLCSATAWRWVQAWGHSLLPVGALFGMVRSSGVIGVDEKYVLVPKNNKPDEGKMRRWMYVYLAVDVWTYDLLHIAIYPHNNHNSALTFLLALRAKGYHPKVIITDLRCDYGPAIATAYPQAVHHECIFHALKNVHKQIKDVYGPSLDTASDALILQAAIDFIFDTADPLTAQARYDGVSALRQAFVLRTPHAAALFDFLDHHWPKLINCLGNPSIPATNNATELVIRRFDQHYQNFCGFDSIETAQSYLGVFEKLYRFSPFSLDAQPRIRNQSPLQLAGYDAPLLPISTICSGFSIDWPLNSQIPLVPNL
jgi:transposase-like protein